MIGFNIAYFLLQVSNIFCDFKGGWVTKDLIFQNAVN